MKKSQKVAEVATKLALNDCLDEAAEILEGYTNQRVATKDPYVKPIKQAFDRFTKELPKKLQQVSEGKIAWNLYSKEEFLQESNTGGGAYLGAVFKKDVDDALEKGVQQSPTGYPTVDISQWAPGEDEFSVVVGLNYEESGTHEFFSDTQATSKETVQILKSKAIKVFQTWLKKNNFVLGE